MLYDAKKAMYANFWSQNVFSPRDTLSDLALYPVQGYFRVDFTNQGYLGLLQRRGRAASRPSQRWRDPRHLERIQLHW